MQLLCPPNPNELDRATFTSSACISEEQEEQRRSSAGGRPAGLARRLRRPRHRSAANGTAATAAAADTAAAVGDSSASQRRREPPGDPEGLHRLCACFSNPTSKHECQSDLLLGPHDQTEVHTFLRGVQVEVGVHVACSSSRWRQARCSGTSGERAHATFRPTARALEQSGRRSRRCSNVGQAPHAKCPSVAHPCESPAPPRSPRPLPPLPEGALQQGRGGAGRGVRLASNAQPHAQPVLGYCTLMQQSMLTDLGSSPIMLLVELMRRSLWGMAVVMARYSAMSPAGVEVAWALT